MQPDCVGAAAADIAPADALPDPGRPAMWMVIALLIAIAIFEVWALSTGHNTISHWFQRLARGRGWVRLLLSAGMLLLWWHLIWGF